MDRKHYTNCSLPPAWKHLNRPGFNSNNHPKGVIYHGGISIMTVSSNPRIQKNDVTRNHDVNNIFMNEVRTVC